MLMDFEKAALNAFKIVHPNCDAENLSRIKLNQCLGGIPVPERKKYADCNTRIVNIVQMYPGMPVLDYLRRIAYNLLQK